MANGELPEGWDLARIRDKFTFTTKPRDLRLNNYKKVAVLPMEAIPTGHLYVREYQEKPPSQISSGTYFEEGDLLLSKITPCFENGKQAIAAETPNGFGIATTEVIPIKPIPCVSQTPFLAYYLLDSEVRASLAGKMEGATGRQRLSKSLLEEWEIAFPPLPEQQAIAGMLSKLQGAVEVQDRIIATLKELKAATLAKLFHEGLRGEPLKETEIGEIPESWEVVRLSTRCRITSGGTPSRGVSDYWGGTIPWVKTGEINYQEILDTEDHITEKGLRASSAKLFPAGTIIMAMYGQGVTRGRVAILGIEATTNQACAAFFPDDTLDQLFLYAFCVYSYDSLRSLAHGGNQQNLSNDLLSAVLLPVPTDKAEQAEIGRILQAIEKRVKMAERRKAEASTLFSSMLHLLITGEVRVPMAMVQSPGGARHGND